MLDQEGISHWLHYYADARAIVLVWQGNGCPIVRHLLPKLRQLETEYAGQGVRFFMVNANPQDDLDSIRQEASEFGIDFPILKDETQAVTALLGVERTADTLLIDPKTWTVAYHGPLDDSLGYEVQKPVSKAYLEEAIGSLLAGRQVRPAPVPAKGCLIDLSGVSRKVSYSADVAPVLEQKCLGCHSSGGIGSWQMTDYKKVKGWVPMMREVLLTKRMPPWGVDARYGRFKNDPSLSIEEYQILLSWIGEGAPRGDGPDPLKDTVREPEPEWPLGKPDLVIDLPPQEIPASGVLPWRMLRVATGLTGEKWIRAAHLKPSNPKVLHHATADTGRPSKAFNMETDPSLHRIAAFVPGINSGVFPEGTGSLLAEGDEIHFVLHYVTTGKLETDRPRLALYFHDSKPPVRLRSTFSNFTRLAIPRYVAQHAVTGDPIRFDKDTLVYDMMAHAHYRCVRFKVTAHYPDGGSKILLSVPDYSFNWQRVYRFSEPERLPAGTVLVPEAVYDNSSANPRNPDPSKTVPFGYQTEDEMLLLYVSYSEPGP